MNLRNIAMGLTLILGSFGLANGQCAGNYSECQPDGDETPCPNGMNNCCEIYNACNGPYVPLERLGTMTLTLRRTGGCDLSCAPIDSGVLFLLLGGAAFGGFLIMRRRETDLIPTRS